MLVKTKSIYKVLVAMAITVQFGQFAKGDLVTESHDNQSGQNVDFVDIDEVDISSSTVTELFFGAPEAVGDKLSFDAFGFRQLAINGDVEFLSGQIKFDITAKDGATFGSVELFEGGSFNLLGDDSSAMVAGNLSIQTDDGMFEGSYNHEMESTSNGAWTGDVTIAFPETDKATVIFSQQLQSVSESQQGVAFVETSFLNLQVQAAVAAVPEPCSFALFSLYGCALVASRRRAG